MRARHTLRLCLPTAREANSWCRPFEWHPRGHLGAASGRTVNAQTSPEHALAHAHMAEAPVNVVAVRIEPLPVVAHRELESTSPLRQRNGNGTRTRVPHHVAQRLLANAKQ